MWHHCTKVMPTGRPIKRFWPSPPSVSSQDLREGRLAEFNQNPARVEAFDWVFCVPTHLWIFQFLRRCWFNTGTVREEVDRRTGWRCLTEEDGRNRAAPTLPSIIHAFSPAEEHTLPIQARPQVRLRAAQLFTSMGRFWRGLMHFQNYCRHLHIQPNKKCELMSDVGHVRDSIRYLCGLSMHRPQAECDLTPGALSLPHNMQLYHPYSGQGRPSRHQSSCCGRGSSVSSAHWQRKWLSFCLPAPTGSRIKNRHLQTNVHVCLIRYKTAFLLSLTIWHTTASEMKKREQNTT